MTNNLLDILGADLEHDSRVWFPSVHSWEAEVPLRFYFAVGLAGEVGELLNLIKKTARDGVEDREKIGFELADSLVYLLLLARAVGVDLDAALAAKRAVLRERWGDPDVMEATNDR